MHKLISVHIYFCRSSFLIFIENMRKVNLLHRKTIQVLIWAKLYSEFPRSMRSVWIWICNQCSPQCQKTLTEFSFSTHHPCLPQDNLTSHLCFSISTTASSWFCCFSHSRSFCVFFFLDFASLGVLPPYWAFVFQTTETENNKSPWLCFPAWSVTPGWGVWVLTRAVTASVCPRKD